MCTFQISITDQLPKVVCQECFSKVEELFDFREKVLQTEGMFMEMLKQIAKEAEDEIDEATITEIESINSINEMQDSNITRHTVQNGIHSIPVIENISLTSREPVVSQDDLSREEADIGVADFHLDGETVRMVNEQMREVR